MPNKKECQDESRRCKKLTSETGIQELLLSVTKDESLDNQLITGIYTKCLESFYTSKDDKK